MKVIIAGGRDFRDYQRLSDLCDHKLQRYLPTELEIVSGTCSGADLLGEAYANERGYSIKRFPADWNKHGKSAGYIRNKQMAEYADALIAFWDGKSKGTKMMIELAQNLGLKVMVEFY